MQPTHPDSTRDAPPTRMSNKSQMSNVSYGRTQRTGFADTGGDDELIPPRRTLRRMYEDQSHYQKDEFLHGIEPAPSSWKPEATTRNTIFHQGFYRGIVTGQDVIRKEHEHDREARSIWREQPRNQRLTDLTKHHFLREDPPARGNGRRHFQEASNIMIRGPERFSLFFRAISRLALGHLIVPDLTAGGRLKGPVLGAGSPWPKLSLSRHVTASHGVRMCQARTVWLMVACWCTRSA